MSKMKTIKKTDFLSVAVMARAGFRTTTECIQIAYLKHADQRAQLAFALIERWGMVSAKEFGEDSAGRQKLAPMTPAEVTERAFACAAAAFETAEARGWVVSLPTWEEAEDVIRSIEGDN